MLRQSSTSSLHLSLSVCASRRSRSVVQVHGINQGCTYVSPSTPFCVQDGVQASLAKYMGTKYTLIKVLLQYPRRNVGISLLPARLTL